MSKKKIIFVSATRADFGKLKSIITTLQKNHKFKVYVFVTGMHLLKEYGMTWHELEYSKIKNIIKFKNQNYSSKEDDIFSKTINGFSACLKKVKPNLVVVHGDRIEALATTITAFLNNTLLAHIEGGEVSGTKDEVIRHSISKLANVHFVSNDEAIKRLIQLGENKQSIFKIGSPEIDIFNSNHLPTLDETRLKYSISFKNYALLIFHPVTDEIKSLKAGTRALINALKKTKKNYVIIHPNNDPGSKIILNEYKKCFSYKHFRFFPSMRFEYYITLLKNSDFIIGNSSSGVREAPSVGVKTINIGTRQFRRSKANTIINCRLEEKSILSSINSLNRILSKKDNFFGKGKANIKFEKIIEKSTFWKNLKLKKFIDIKIN